MRIYNCSTADYCQTGALEDRIAAKTDAAKRRRDFWAAKGVLEDQEEDEE